jgi:hypothetical protein
VTTSNGLGRRVALMLALMVAGGTAGLAGGQQASQAAKSPLTALKLEVVISRFQGDRKTASLPFTLWPTSNGGGVSLRMGVDVPVGTESVTNESSTPNRTSTTATTSNHVDYRNVGTSIDCTVSNQFFNNMVEDGRFVVDLRVQDSSVFTTGSDPHPPLKVADPMAFRTFSMNNRLAMRDGQTQQFATATDKITGDVIKVDVTLTIVK